ncbi:MAG: aminotransferase class V-fold PLP-dependent enzyme [Planctomycetota bacterium]
MTISSDAVKASLRGAKLLEHVRRDVIGLDTEYRLATGQASRRVYLDSTATTLKLGAVDRVSQAFLPHYSNTHSLLHFGAKLATQSYHWAHDKVLEFVRADPKEYAAIFLGSGATAGFNRVARSLSRRFPERDVVITTMMEHHANDLPHRAHFNKVVHVGSKLDGWRTGCLDLAQLEKALKEYQGRVAYVTATGVSNVTGIVNPVEEIAELAHRYDTLCMIDAAQMAAHVPMQVSRPDAPEKEIDLLCFSGHKIYAPGSPGVLVTRRSLFDGNEPCEMGGGIVDHVFVDDYIVAQSLPEREEAGTPDIVGAIELAAALEVLDRIGMDLLEKEEDKLIRTTIDALEAMPEVTVYGVICPNAVHRVGCVTFNIVDIEHGLTAAILNDYHNVAVRNECFCAHPYVKDMITLDLERRLDDLDEDEIEAIAEQSKGMVRASFGLYSTEQDVERLVTGVRDIIARRDEYAPLYERLPNGDYRHKKFSFDPSTQFSVRGVLDACYVDKTTKGAGS